MFRQRRNREILGLASQGFGNNCFRQTIFRKEDLLGSMDSFIPYILFKWLKYTYFLDLKKIANSSFIFITQECVINMFWDFLVAWYLFKNSVALFGRRLANIPLPILASVLRLPLLGSRLCNIRRRESRIGESIEQFWPAIKYRARARHPNQFSLSAEGLFTSGPSGQRFAFADSRSITGDLNLRRSCENYGYCTS